MICKIPFAPPDSAVAEAKAEWIKSQGGDDFDELTVPEAGLVLKQWTGRAHRRESDYAEVYLLDPRFITRGYGRRLLQGLPPLPLFNADAIEPRGTPARAALHTP